MKLKNYAPSGNQIVLHLKQYDSIGGIILPDAEPDKVLRVVAVGELCTKAKVDSYVMLNDRPYPQMTMQDEGGKELSLLFATEFDIIGFYTPDPGETQFYIGIRNKNGKGGHNAAAGPMDDLKILPGTNTEASPFLNEKVD